MLGGMCAVVTVHAIFGHLLALFVDGQLLVRWKRCVEGDALDPFVHHFVRLRSEEVLGLVF